MTESDDVKGTILNQSHLDIAREVSSIISAVSPGVRRVVLFGSTVLGGVDGESDVDIAIVYGNCFNDTLIFTEKALKALEGQGFKAVSHLENFSGPWSKIIHFGVYNDESGLPFNLEKQGLTLFYG